MGLLRLTLLGLSGTILAACGGTTTQSIPVTLAPPAEGYATISTTVAGGSSFSSTTNRRLRLISGGASDTVVFSDEDIAITISASAVTATIVMNGNTYVFTQEPTRPTLYTSADGSVEIFVNPSQTLLIAELRISNDDPMGSSGTENHGHFVAGYQTDPAQVAALTGSASYTGGTLVEYFDGGNELFGLGDGTLSLTADFGANAVHGTLDFQDSDTGAEADVPTIDITFNSTMQPNISGNEFSGGISGVVDTSGGNVGTVANGGLTGTFFGMNAAAVGGTFWGDGTLNGAPMHFQGAFGSN